MRKLIELTTSPGLSPDHSQGEEHSYLGHGYTASLGSFHDRPPLFIATTVWENRSEACIILLLIFASGYPKGDVQCHQQVDLQHRTVNYLLCNVENLTFSNGMLQQEREEGHFV